MGLSHHLRPLLVVTVVAFAGLARCVGSDDSSIPDAGGTDATTDTSSPDTSTDAGADTSAEAEAGPTCIVPDSGAPGSLDTTFNTSALSIPNNFGAAAIAIDTSGNVYVAGSASGSGCTSSASAFGLVRLTSTGSIDTTFNPGDAPKCYTIDANTNGQNVAYAVAIDSAGNIVMGGLSGHTGHYFASVVRVTSTGALDTTFNGTGMLDVLGAGVGVSAGFGNGFVTIYGIAIGAGNKVILSGTDDNGGSANPFQAGYIARLTSGGALDIGFASGGLYSDPSVHGYWGVTVNPTDNGVTAVGYDREAPTHMVLRHLTGTSGVPDGTFGTPTTTADAGLATTPAFTDGGRNDIGRSVIQLPNGEFLLAGLVGSNTYTGIVGAALFHLDGKIDTSFGGGTTTATASGLTFYAFFVTSALGSLCNGNMYVMGDVGSDPNEELAVAKLLTNGQFDGTFGTGGLTTITGVSGDHIPAQMAQDPITGKLVVVGTGTGTTIVARINP
jgi:uncharacterized delta-60 repeat protein